MTELNPDAVGGRTLNEFKRTTVKAFNRRLRDLKVVLNREVGRLAEAIFSNDEEMCQIMNFVAILGLDLSLPAVSAKFGKSENKGSAHEG